MEGHGHQVKGAGNTLTRHRWRLFKTTSKPTAMPFRGGLQRAMASGRNPCTRSLRVPKTSAPTTCPNVTAACRGMTLRLEPISQNAGLARSAAPWPTLDRGPTAMAASSPVGAHDCGIPVTAAKISHRRGLL